MATSAGDQAPTRTPSSNVVPPGPSASQGMFQVATWDSPWPEGTSCDDGPQRASSGHRRGSDHSRGGRRSTFNVSDIAASLVRVDGLLEEDDGEEDNTAC